VAKLWSYHNRNFTKKSLHCLCRTFLVFINEFFFFSLREGSFLYWYLFKLLHLNIYINFCCICKISYSSFMRKYCRVTFIRFLYSWRAIYMNLIKDNFHIIIILFSLTPISRHELWLNLNPSNTVLFHNFLYIHLKETIEWWDLLGY